MGTIKDLLNKLNIRAKNEQLFIDAFTHASFKGNLGFVQNYERLEFAGDAVLGFVIATKLFEIYPELDQGKLTVMKHELVQTKSLAHKARELKFDQMIRVGNSISLPELTANDSFFEDVFEAFIGAIYFDQGIEIAKRTILNLFHDELYNFDLSATNDYKSTLQEYVQAEKRGELNYKLIERSGPSHDPTYRVSVEYDGVKLGEGVAKTIKGAEKLAAKDALSKVAR